MKKRDEKPAYDGSNGVFECFPVPIDCRWEWKGMRVVRGWNGKAGWLSACVKGLQSNAPRACGSSSCAERREGKKIS